MLRGCLGMLLEILLLVCRTMFDLEIRHSPEELEAMDEDQDNPPPMSKLNQTLVNGA